MTITRRDSGGMLRGDAMARRVLLCAMLILCFGCSTKLPSDGAASDGIKHLARIASPPVESIAWSPTNLDQILVTASQVGQGRGEVSILNLSTGQIKIIAQTSYGDFVAATWVPDGRRILLLVRDRTMGFERGGVWILSAETGKGQFLIDSGISAWSPLDDTIATFSTLDAADGGPSGIALAVVDATTMERRVIYTNKESQYAFGLSWAPDGMKVVFGLGKDNPGDLYTLDTQTDQVVQITRGKAASDPAWSPDGSVIAYVNWPGKGDRTTLHIMSPEGRCDMEIAGLEYVSSPTWSPDGKELAYISGEDVYQLDVHQALGIDASQDLCRSPA